MKKPKTTEELKDLVTQVFALNEEEYNERIKLGESIGRFAALAMDGQIDHDPLSESDQKEILLTLVALTAIMHENGMNATQMVQDYIAVSLFLKSEKN